MKFILITFLLFSGISYFAQQTIKVKREKNTFLFYQSGLQKDTITPASGNLFYLVVSDSLKPYLYLQTENAQFVKTSNDSVYRLIYVYGVNYECSYGKGTLQKHSKTEEASWTFKCLVNGASGLPKNEIRIRFKIEVRPNSDWEGKFYYKK